jgi:peptidoglycan-N-acetylglucosamine deacetylase
VVEKPIKWLNGYRCAVNFSFDMDAESLLHIYFPDTAHNRVAMASRLRYGPEVAVPRIVDAFKQLGLQQTFFIPGWCMEQYPRAIALIAEHGHEIAHHGYIHEKINQLTREQERAVFFRAFDSIVKATGRPPRGFRAPSGAFSRHTVDFLVEAGLDYDASLAGHDIPYLIGNGRARWWNCPTMPPWTTGHSTCASASSATCCPSRRRSGPPRCFGPSSTRRGGTGCSGIRSGTHSCRVARPAATRWSS